MHLYTHRTLAALSESTLIVCALSVKVLMERFCCHQLFACGDTNNRMANRRSTMRAVSRNLVFSKKSSFSVHAPMEARNASRVLSPCRRGVLLFVLHLNSAPAILATWTRGEMRFSISPSLLSLSVSRFPPLSSSSSLPLLPAISFSRSFFLPLVSRSHRRWSFRTRGDTSRPWRTCSPRATSILTHPRCKSTNAFCASGTHAIQRALLRWVP